MLYHKPNLDYLRRMRLTILAFVAFIIGNSPLSAQVENDKVIHFAVGAVAGAAGAFVASELSGKSRFWTVTGAIASSLAAGLVKEAVDKRRYGSWDNADLGATVLGGVTVGITIELFSKKNGHRYQSRRAIRNAALVEKSPETLFLKDSSRDNRVSSNSDQYE